MEKGHSFLQGDVAQGPFPSRQLCWLEMALSPGDHCHFLLISETLAQLSQAQSVPAQTHVPAAGR